MTTPSRDDELDALERELRRELRVDTPYIEKPDELPVDVGGACFLDRHRMCTPECTAHLGPDLPTAVERCAVLSAATRGADLIEQLVQLGNKNERRAGSVPSIPPPHLDPASGPGPGLGSGWKRWP